MELIKINRIVLLFIGLIIITVSGINCNCNNNTSPSNTPNTSLDLTGKAVSSSQIDLNWIFGNPPDGLSKSATTGSRCSPNGVGFIRDKINFKIERKTDLISVYNEIAVVGTNINCYSDTGLKEDTVYYYRILAYNSNGYSKYSNEVSLSTAISWILVPSDNRPSPLYGHAMAYDSARNRIVLFGGSDWSDGTWERDGTQWILRLPNHKPSGRYGHVMAYDSGRGKVVLFGGIIGSSDKDIRSDETWEWDGTDWTLKSPNHKPSGRRYPAMEYDSGRGKVVLFGGETDSAYSDETWEWDGTDWTLRTPVHKPLGLWGTAMTYDSKRHKIMFYRGFGWTNELWSWDGTDWTLIKSPANSSAKCSHAMVYDSARDRIVCIGQDETWEYDGIDWSLKSPENKPMPVWGHILVYDVARCRTVLFGGVIGCYPTNDTWEWGY